MYLQHFGLSHPPFSLTPDTASFLNAGSHREALNVLLVALRSGEGFLKITGEIGTGKTLLCRRLLAELHGEFVTAYVPNPFVSPNGLRAALADELGLSYPRNLGQHHLLRLINERLLGLNRQGTPVVVIIDEAQSMPDVTLEALRLLSNLETEQQKLLRIVLFGQPELDERLARPKLRQLSQRIGFAYRLSPLPRPLVPVYLQHRLRAAGFDGEAVFSRGAVRVLGRASRGIPRLINILAHKAMMAAYGQGCRRVDGRHVRAAVRDTESVRRPPANAGLGPAWAVGVAVAALFAAWALWRYALPVATASGS